MNLKTSYRHSGTMGLKVSSDFELFVGWNERVWEFRCGCEKGLKREDERSVSVF